MQDLGCEVSKLGIQNKEEFSNKSDQVQGPHRRTLVFFGNFCSEIQMWESTSFGAKLG